MSNEMSEKSSNVRGRVVVFSGPSGVGKGTLMKRLFAETDLPLTMSVSATTRAPRVGEKNGVDYWFLSREEFLARRERDEFLESFEVYSGGSLYGTLRETVEQTVASGRWVVLEIDVKGALSVAQKIKDAITIFIAPPSVDELRVRLCGRGTESQEDIERRLAQAKSEIEASSFYRYQVVNDDLDRALHEIIEILRREQAATA